MSTRGVGLVRLLRMQRELRGQWWTVTELSKKFKVHRRTIWRDLDVLRAAEVRVEELKGRAGQETRFRVWW